MCSSDLGLDSLVIRGMAIRVVKTPLASSRNIPSDTKTANVIIDEAQAPPGWASSWGLMILAGILTLVSLRAMAEMAKNS